MTNEIVIRNNNRSLRPASSTMRQVGNTAINVLSNKHVQSIIKQVGNEVYQRMSRRPKNQDTTLSLIEKSVPISKGTTMTRRAPDMKYGSRGTVTVRNRELLYSIPGSTSWTLQKSIEVNPGIPESFPWLASLAANYQEYRFRRLYVVFVSSSSTAESGNIILTPVYDASVPPPTTETEASDQIDTKSTNIWNTINCPLSARSMFPMGPKKYIRSYSMAGDIKTYDAALFHISTVGCDSTDTIGRIFLDYEVELMTPKLQMTGTFSPNSMTYLYQNGNQTFNDNTLTKIAFSGNQFLIEGDNSMRATLTSTGILLPAGFYRVAFKLFFTPGTAASLESILVDIEYRNGFLTRFYNQAITNPAEQVTLSGEIMFNNTNASTHELAFQVTIQGLAGGTYLLNGGPFSNHRGTVIYITPL